MMNMRLIEEAVKLVIDLYEAEGIIEATDTIRARAINWYERTEIIDAEMLAAATITGSYQIGTSWDDLLNWKEFYFPSAPTKKTIVRIDSYHFDDNTMDWLNSAMEDEMLTMESFHIGEIEAAQRDTMWQ